MKHIINWIAALLMLSLLFIGPAPQAQAQSSPLKLSGDLRADNKFKISPDGSRIVFRAEYNNPELRQQLYSAPLDGSAPPVLLSHPFPGTDTTVGSFLIAPNSSYVVFEVQRELNIYTDNEDPKPTDIYSVPLNGGVPVRLNALLPDTGSVIRYEISPDSSRVVYIADQATDNIFNVYSVAIAGGVAPTKLNNPPVAVGDVWHFRISPDSSRVVYVGNQEHPSVYELYSVPIAGGTNTKLNVPLPAGADVSDLSPVRISPDSSRVVYVVDQQEDYNDQLYSVPIAGGTNVKLYGSPTEGELNMSVHISPDSSRVVYFVRETTSNTIKLYSSPIAGGAPLSLDIIPMDYGVMPNFVAISANSSKVIYVADRDTDRVDELYSVPLLGGPSVKLNGPLPASGDVLTSQFNPSSNRVIYRADQDTNNIIELYSVPSGGGASVKLNDLITAGSNVDAAVITADGSQAVYLADQSKTDHRELWRVSIMGGSPIKINGPLASGENVRWFVVSPEGSRVVYLAQHQKDPFPVLYVASLGTQVIVPPAPTPFGLLTTP